MFQYCVAEDDVELVRCEGQRFPGLDASGAQPGVLPGEVRAVLGTDHGDLRRVRIELLEVVGLLLLRITGDAHVENAHRAMPIVGGLFRHWSRSRRVTS
jgi:hypothetical protein